MAVNKRAAGADKEQLAARYLVDNGYTVLERNFRNKTGEIDIIAKKDNYIVFVEVKYRSNNKYGYAVEAVNYRKKHTTSCCPAFVNLIKKQYPELAEHISTTISPMFALSRLLKSEDPDTITVFIGPCIAKKNEKQEYKGQGNADFVLTLGEFRAMMRAKEVVLEPEENSDQQASIYGKRFGNGGGVSAAVAQCMREAGADPDKFNIEKCSGAAECKKALTLLKVGKLPADFIEGMVCEGGCVGGPSRHRSGKNPVLAAKDRDKLLAEADDRNVSDNLSKYDLTAFSMHK